MELTTLIETHRQNFRKKVVEVLAKKNSMSPEQVERELRDAVDRFVDERYEPVIKAAERIGAAEKPVLLNIRRDRAREDKCKI